MDAMNSVSITGGGYTAEVSLLGGQLLNLTHHEDELIVPAAKTDGSFAGAVLAPWPNRTKGGSYTYNGVEHLLPVNEEATGAALHGLLIDLPLRVISEKESEVQLAGWLESSEGYPFGLDIALTYRVSADVGLAATLMARYRPEQLEDGAPETEAPLVEADDSVLAADGVEAGDLEASEGARDDDDDVSPGADEPDSAGLRAAEPDSDTPDADAADALAADSDTPDGDTPDGETAEDEDLKHDLAASASEDQESAAPDAAVADADATDTEVADTDVPDGEASEAEVRDADAPDADIDGTDATPAQVPQTAPFGAGFHPYLTAGGASLRECRLRLPARTMLKTKADGTVTGRKSVSQDFDLTNGPLLAGRNIDHAFTDLPEEGWTAELIHGPSGFVVRMIADSPWVQVYTGERIDRAGVAVEPMTCPPNALNSGEDLIHLEPGKWFRMGYSIEAIRAD
ncbi:aldose epimerase family protein [Nesterenkonia sp. DZ6]|uniref:aldose epimerase family protein n=1 Tax=Nesterenkonia sp. DZ6 TaxID=2901229 RepID=UPI001F4D2E2A|nr:hypothetical protein [Nesterenkonia sp. DZ6]MCH8561005.1 hypothetical protein [Nesterenkonia sp. DZ6]